MTRHSIFSRHPFYVIIHNSATLHRKNVFMYIYVYEPIKQWLVQICRAKWIKMLKTVFSQYKCHVIVWCYDSIPELLFHVSLCMFQKPPPLTWRNVISALHAVDIFLVWKVKIKLFEIKQKWNGFCPVHHSYSAFVTFLKPEIFRISKN